MNQAFRSSAKIIRLEHFDRTTPQVAAVKSVVSKTEYSAKPGELIRLEDSRLKFDETDPSLGVFLSSDDKTESRCEIYALIQPSVLVANVPLGLAIGEYQILVRTKPTGKILKWV